MCTTIMTVSKTASGDRAPSMLQTADRALQVLQLFASPGEALTGRELVSVAKPLMDRLASRTGETVTLGVPAGVQVLNAAQSDGRHFVSSGRWVGVHAPPHCCSDGKVLLAFGALEVPDGRLARLASNTITDRRALAREVEQVR